MKNLIGYALAALLALAGMFSVNRCTDSGNAAEIARWKIQKQQADSVVQVKDSLLAEANARNAASVPVYLAGRDRIIRVAAGTPAAEPVKACFELADSRISACEGARKAADSVITALRHDLKVTEAKPEPEEKRFVVYGAAGYSMTIAEKATWSAPAFRAGIDIKIPWVPIRIATDAQLTMPGQGRSNPMWQGNAMLKIHF